MHPLARKTNRFPSRLLVRELLSSARFGGRERVWFIQISVSHRKERATTENQGGCYSQQTCKESESDGIWKRRRVKSWAIPVVDMVRYSDLARRQPAGRDGTLQPVTQLYVPLRDLVYISPRQIIILRRILFLFPSYVSFFDAHNASPVSPPGPQPPAVAQRRGHVQPDHVCCP